MFKKICSLLLVCTLIFSAECFAKPGGGGSRSSGGFSSSRSSSSRSSFSSPSRSSSGFSSKPSTPSAPKPSVSTPSRSSGGFSSQPKAPIVTPNTTGSKPVTKPTTSSSTGFSPSTQSSFKPKPSSPVDLQAAKQVRVGNVTMTKDQAVNDFKTKHASTYTSSYKTEPTSRPSHIPQSTSVGGKTVNITYNSSNGGYGYMHPLTGAWMAYDVMSDMAMMSMLMHNNHGYAPVVATTQVPVSAGTTVVATNSSFSFFSFFFTFFMILGLILIVGIIIKLLH